MYRLPDGLVVHLGMVVISGNIVSRKPSIRPEFDDAARHFVDGGVLGAVFIKQRRIDFGGQQQPIGLDAGIVNSVQGMESHIQNIFEFLRIEDDVIHLCTVGGSERQGITLENEELTVSSGRGKPINNASRGIRSQRVGRERVAVHAIGSDGNDDLIQVGVERRRIGEFLRTSGWSLEERTGQCMRVSKPEEIAACLLTNKM